VLLVCTLCVLCGSCASVSPGNDPLVVNAERTAKLAFNTVDAFLEWEYINRSLIGQDVTDTADSLREFFPENYATLRNLTKAYKLNRTAENRASLTTALRVVQTALNEALKYLPPPEPTP